MNILWGNGGNPEINEALANWCAAHLGFKRPFEPPYSTMGVFDGDEIVAVLVYNNYHPEDGVIEIHGASETPRWLAKPVLREIFSFPFDRLGCQIVIMRVSERDTRLLRILTAIGFDHVVIPRLRGRDEGERIFWLTDDAWHSSKFS